VADRCRVEALSDRGASELGAGWAAAAAAEDTTAIDAEQATRRDVSTNRSNV